MAATRKSAKRNSGKRPAAKKKRSGKISDKSSKKKRAGKISDKSSRSKTKKGVRRTTALRRRAVKGLGAARDGFDSVLEAGGKTWRTLKNTTALMVEGVKETLAGEPAETGRRRPRRR